MLEGLQCSLQFAPQAYRVLPVAAMEAEAQPLLERLGLQKDDPPPIAAPAPALSFSGKALGLDLHIVCNGEAARNSVLGQQCRCSVQESWTEAEY